MFETLHPDFRMAFNFWKFPLEYVYYSPMQCFEHLCLANIAGQRLFTNQEAFDGFAMTTLQGRNLNF